MNEFILALLKCNRIGNTKAYEFIVKNNFNVESMKKNLNNFIGDLEYKKFEQYLEESLLEIKKNLEAEIKLITILDEKFPTKLYTIVDPILYLFYKGDINLINTKSIAVIGTRKPKYESIQNTDLITKLLVNSGFTIIGGLALGIDTIGHQSTMKYGGKTIAVLPSGIDNIQPSSNKKLAADILKNDGCLVSEYSVGNTFNIFNYAKRDRIQSALANAIFVSEATEKSGTMIAVNKAIKENIPIFQLETNCNSIIKNTLKSNGDDIENICNSANENFEKKITREKIYQNLSEEQISLF